MAYFHCLIGGGSSGGGYELTVTCDADFAGTTITCTDGVTTLTQTCPSSSPYEVVFAIPNGGEWTISGIISGQTYSVSVDIPDSLGLHSVPEGSTVLPTDDIQIWLKCAEITDKSYTTLNEVLADSTTLLALMSNNNAVDYLVRSTTWASGITADSTAMTDIGANNYCANTLLADSTWLTAICNSTYFESVLNTKVPTMTGATTPSGEVYTNSALNATYAGWKAFNGVLGVANDSNRWVSVGGQSGTNAFLMYDFIDAVPVNMAKIYAVIGNNAYEHPVAATIYIEGSQDNSIWEPITSKELTTTEMSQYTDIIFENSTAYRSYRVYFNRTNIYGTASDYYSQIRSLQFYGREDV